MELQTALYVDLVAVTVALLILRSVRDLRLFHPGVIYLAFHLSVFTWRFWQVAMGAPRGLRLTDGEAMKAIVTADLFLIVAMLAWAVASNGDRTFSGRPRVLDRPVIVWTAIIGIPAGIALSARYLYLPSRGFGSEVVSSYQTFGLSWPSLLLVALIYIKGFRWQFLLPLLVYLSILGLQGESRVRVIIPVLWLLLIYVERRRRRWPSPAVLGGLCAIPVVYYPMDYIGELYQRGELSWAALTNLVPEVLRRSAAGENLDAQLFDMFAVGMGQSDVLAKPNYGRHFLDLLYLPVPRPWWPEKPVVNEHLVELGTASRPLTEIGTILTLPGEAYVDFRYPGVIVVASLFGWLTGRWYRAATAAGYGTVTHFAYLFFSGTLVQIYRDGLVGVPLFMFVHGLPVVVIILLSAARGTRDPRHVCAESPSTKFRM